MASLPIIGNPLGYFHDPLESTLPLMAELGYDQIEICHSQITEFKTPELRGQFQEYIQSLGMKLVGSNVPDSVYFQTLHCSEDIKVALAGLQRDLDIASELGVQYLITFEGRIPAGLISSSLDRFWTTPSNCCAEPQSMRRTSRSMSSSKCIPLL